MLLSLIPFGGITQSDTVVISLEQYKMMSTCPVYLSECEEMRYLDSLEKSILHNSLSKVSNDNNRLSESVKKQKKAKFKWGAIGVAIGLIASVFI